MKAEKNCWTCKERKIGCDRAIPTCLNCQRSQRQCRGYSIKLAWPDKADGRRKQKVIANASIEENQWTDYARLNDGLPFLNTTVQDLRMERLPFHDLFQPSKASMTLPRSISFGQSMETLDDTYLLSYYESVLARMITTIDDGGNRFRNGILPMALSVGADASRSLFKAILAVSAVHLGRTDEAFTHKASAIQSLAASVNPTAGSEPVQLAACMMLCVFSVFDPTDTSWYIHLQGARTISKTITNVEDTGLDSFLLSWLDYHDVLREYNEASFDPDCNFAWTDRLLPVNPSRTIIGSLGCSEEVLALISSTNKLRKLQSSYPDHDQESAATYLQVASQIRNQLRGLKQEVFLQPGAGSGEPDLHRIRITAEFYRIAACLYLEQVARDCSPEVVHYVQTLIRKGFSLLNEMETCTSPWPLFILACHSTSDEQRIRILRELEAMQSKRRIGNLQVLEGIIKAVWCQEDIIGVNANGSPTPVDWRNLIAMGSPMPSFV